MPYKDKEKRRVYSKEYEQRPEAKIRKREYYKQNRDRIKIYKKEYERKNRDIIKIKRKEYYKQNKEIIKDKRKRYRDKHKDKIKEWGERYYKKNKEDLTKKSISYYKKNKNRIRIRAKKYNEENKNKNKIYNKKYNLENKDKINIKKKEYLEKNKEIIKFKAKIYHERNKKAKCIICGKPAPSKYCSTRCTAIGRMGKNHHNWKGGIIPTNHLIRNSQKYKNWRMSVFERDKYTCVICGKVGCYIEAHHIQSFAEFPKLRFDINNGITVCKDCHGDIDEGRRRFKK